MDQDNKEALFKLLRYNVNFKGTPKDYVSLDEYVSEMKEGQTHIYYSYSNTYQAALDSPFYESLKQTGVPVLILTN